MGVWKQNIKCILMAKILKNKFPVTKFDNGSLFALKQILFLISSDNRINGKSNTIGTLLEYKSSNTLCLFH